LWLQIVLAGASVFCTSALLAMASLPFQFTAPLPSRAQAIAVQGVVASLIGTGLGPLLVGLASDALRSAAAPLALALALVGGIAAPLVALLLTIALRAHRVRRLDLARPAVTGVAV
jgi:hypothetical protein